MVEKFVITPLLNRIPEVSRHETARAQKDRNRVKHVAKSRGINEFQRKRIQG